MREKPVSKGSGQNSKEDNQSAASIVFMIFGLVLVVSAMFLFHTKKNQASFSSVRPSKGSNQIDLDTSVDRKRKVEGLEINNQRMTAEVKKEQEMLNLGNKRLGSVEAQDNLMKDMNLSGEPNSQDQNRDRLRDDRASYPDVFVPHELAIDHELYDQAKREEQNDRKVFIEGLKKRAAAQNLDVQYDPKTGEIVIDRIPQSEEGSTTQPGFAK